jgi:transcriptional regulator with XRE-family HTH domain
LGAAKAPGGPYDQHQLHFDFVSSVTVVERERESAAQLANALHFERNPIRAVRLMVEGFGLEQRQVASACGTSISSVSEWLSGSDERVPHQRERILELAYVVFAILATRSISIDRAREWLVSPMDYFLGDAPLTAIAAGDFLRAAEAGQDFATGKLPV